uniref:hypothetical protein n=1 Tax=Ornithobacterium rhinotracheale TaxID=28251 RepID=UPI001C86E773|nr:hypothetical protein [Ornithobacterium rhinotracheale]
MISFLELIQIYRRSRFEQNSGRATFYIKNNEDLTLIKELSSNENFEKTGLFTIDSSLEVGKTIHLEFETPKSKFGRFYDTIESFVKGDMALINDDSLRQSPYYIKSEDIASFDENQPQTILNYLVIKDFLYQLIEMSSYTDNVNRKLIFFSKKTFELSFDISNHTDTLVSLLTNLHNKDYYKSIINFKEWLNDEETSSHIDEKKSILAFVLSDMFSHKQNANFINVIEFIQDINKSVQAQYALYLENFSYEKFVKKLEENSEKFVTKINDTINKVLPQFLGLPLLTAIPVALKSGDNWLIYLALLIYCIICICALSHQKLVLDYIKEDVKNFEEKGKIPEKLRSQWDIDETRINKLIQRQKTLYCILLITAILCLIYSFVKLFPTFELLYHTLQDILQKKLQDILQK